MFARRCSLAGIVAIVLAVSACALDEAPAVNKYAGCYDHSCVSAPVLVPGVPPFTTLTAKTSHTCGLTSSGEAWCWGDNSMGQLGDGTDLPRTAPVKVAGNFRFSAITAGALLTCGITVDGIAACWGVNGTAQLGQPSNDRCSKDGVQCAKSPLPLPGRRYKAIAAGLRHVCAIDAGGAAYCWGFNFLGEAGSSAYGETVASPHLVPNANIFTSIGAGDSFTCALAQDDLAFCWGSGGRGELGRAVGQCNSVIGFVNVCSPVPLPVNTTVRFASLSVGNSHVCGLTASGTVMCWGDNGQGQLGTRAFDNRATPVVSQNGLTFAAIDASGAATCGTPTSGTSVCWGLNLFGKLGTGTRIELSTAPVAIAGGRRFVSFAGGGSYVCGLVSDGVAYCWGSGREGQLGTGVLLP